MANKSRKELKLLLELKIIRYQLNQLANQGKSEANQMRKLLERKPQPLLLDRV